MILTATQGYTVNVPQSILSSEETDPRTSATSDYLDKLRKYVWESEVSIREGQMKALDSEFAPLDKQLDGLEHLKEGWDGYTALVPTIDTINEARQILRSLHRELLKPQRISASADGGVAFSFRASGDRRAQVEILNNGEKFAHLYDLRGNSYTHEWPEAYEDAPFRSLLEPILSFMQP